MKHEKITGMTVLQKIYGETLGKTDDSDLYSMIGILSILSKPDALSIFLLAHDGIRSEIESHSKIGITQKQYYTRLKQLLDANLISKTDLKQHKGVQKQYVQSRLGMTIFKNYIQNIIQTIKDSNELEVLEVLKDSKKFDDAQITKIASKIGIQRQIISDTTTKNETFFIATTYDKMSQTVVDAINNARKEIILASRFFDESVIHAMIEKSQTGVNITVLADTTMVKGYSKNEKIKNDKNKKERVQLVSDPFYPTKIKRRYSKIPFCILVVDQKFVGWELVNSSETSKFDKAMFCYNFALVNDMMDTFQDWWSMAKEESPLLQKTTISKST